MYQLVYHICKDPIVYATFTVMVATLMVFGYLLQMFEKQQNWDYMGIMFNGLSVFLSIPCSYYPTNNANRLGFGFALLGAIIFVTVTTKTIIQLYTLPLYNTQVDKIHGILDNDFDLVGSRFALEKMLKQNEVKFLICSIILQSFNPNVHPLMYEFRRTPQNHCANFKSLRI